MKPVAIIYAGGALVQLLFCMDVNASSPLTIL
jgi:hypothetical protein